MRRLRTYLSIIILGSIIMSCGRMNSGDNSDNIDKPNVDSDIVELQLWSYYGGFDEIIEGFEKENPNIKVKISTFPYEEYELKYKESMIKENGDADILIIDSNEYGEFNSINGLENLLDDKYNATKYREDYDKELWELGKSIDKSKLLGLPIASAPIVTYYRADIMEAYGFPSNPKELAEFMRDANNWLEIGKKLKADDKYIVQWIGEIVRISTSDMAYFDENLEYQRDNERFKEAIEIARKGRDLGISPYNDIWSDTGIKMLKEDKFAMLYLGSWEASELETLVPEQKGKWRVTALPFGAYGWNNASIISIPENSGNKDAAWKFIEYYIFKHNDKNRLGNVSGYLPFRGVEENLKHKNEFLGGQEDQRVYEELMSKTQEYSVTPLDKAVFKLWDDIVNEGLENGNKSDEILANIKSQVNSKFSKEIKILKNKIKV
ncbi:MULTISPECIES: ABC transporter substrate-binding protein [Clostridium]|uniref:ABC transporter substrate-binding protein n=2 Tax=Clostridiaceae TaxID=31979 RepID=UPI000479DD99|nr:MULTISPECIES: extracellular solute-binding protein [Clostridium]MBS6888858.1 extracellular solute-binding protein [Clostridium sp.]MDB2073551.1 extracellular solute-binding protein [Clostridium paraputrificum]MDB2081091.1 extracellular solute-binding protein [Clostridium paraputrificum]MDB2122965.1 extracellular solute-binding protein [Clostridium paraputrificum]MDU1585543.1 extracellular solute-binding protein [Clostridium sp.]